VTERTIVADEVTCPKCYSKEVMSGGVHDMPGQWIIFSAECINGHKLNWKREMMIVSWAIESTEVSDAK
jgi:hypothetical protein